MTAINHRWTLDASAGGRDTFTCERCDMSVQIASGHRPSASRARVVNGRPLPAKWALPPCSVQRGSRRNTKGTDRANLCASREWRDLLATCTDVLGRQWVRDHLELDGPSLDEEQEIELVRLHAAVRVYLLEARDVLDLVERQVEAKRRARARELAESRGGEQMAAFEGSRRVNAAGGAA